MLMYQLDDLPPRGAFYQHNGIPAREDITCMLVEEPQGVLLSLDALLHPWLPSSCSPLRPFAPPGCPTSGRHALLFFCLGSVDWLPAYFLQGFMLLALAP